LPFQIPLAPIVDAKNIHGCIDISMNAAATRSIFITASLHSSSLENIRSEIGWNLFILGPQDIP
jgi:hypothetical protein